jgi:hypothetical protein
MSTYYKYQNPSEIGAAPTLDWGTVVQNVNETLQKQEQIRFENREADKKITNDILTKVNELNLTNDPTANALITNMAYEAKTNIFELKKKLESGQISRSDFNILNQNTSSSIAQLNQFSKTYAADYDKYMKDVAEGKTSAYADFMQKWKGGFQNFKYKKLIHNPTDGRLYVAELDDNGKVKEGEFGLVPMSVLVEAKNFDDKKIDVLAETNRFAGQLKPFVEMVRRGKIESVEALENMPGFEEFVANATEAIAKNEKGYASILTDTDGSYFITSNPTSMNKEIGLKNNGAGEFIPQITDEMKKAARDVIKRYFIAQTGIKETGTEVFAPREPRSGGSGKEDIIPTTNDIEFSAGQTKGQGFTGVQKFTIKTPVVEDSTGSKRSLKSMVYDPETGNLRLEVEVADKDFPGKITKVDYANFTRKTTEEVPVAPGSSKTKNVSKTVNPDIATLDIFARKIFVPELNRYLTDHKELLKYLEAKKNPAVKKTGNKKTSKKETAEQRAQRIASGK